MATVVMEMLDMRATVMAILSAVSEAAVDDV